MRSALTHSAPTGEYHVYIEQYCPLLLSFRVAGTAARFFFPVN